MILQILAECLAKVPSEAQLEATGSKVPVGPDEIVIGALTPQEASLRLAIIAQDKVLADQRAIKYDLKASFCRDRIEENAERVRAQKDVCLMHLNCLDSLMRLLCTELRERLKYEPGCMISVRDGLKVVKFVPKDIESDCIGFEVA